MNNLVERLRSAAKASAFLATILPKSNGNAMTNLLNEAADTIERTTEAVVEAVRCKDCAYLGFKDFYGICEDGPMTGIVQPWDYCSKGVRKKAKEEKRDRSMTYLGAIEICKKIEEHSEEEALQAIEKILGMETINATPKEALLNVVRWFWKRCVTTTEEAEEKDDSLG